MEYQIYNVPISLWKHMFWVYILGASKIFIFSAEKVFYLLFLQSRIYFSQVW